MHFDVGPNLKYVVRWDAVVDAVSAVLLAGFFFIYRRTLLHCYLKDLIAHMTRNTCDARNIYGAQENAITGQSFPVKIAYVICH